MICSVMYTQQLLTIQDVADLLKVDILTVRRYIKSGKIKAVKPSPRVVRILSSEVDYLLGSHKMEANGQK
jgi:excisionase family DNA binding protein